MSPLWNSLLVALAAIILASPFALGAGWVLARKDFPGKSILHLLILSPLVLPPVVTGYLLLTCLGRNSLIGSFFASTFNIHLSFSLVSAVLAATVVGLPLFVAGVRIAIEAVPKEVEEIAQVSGATPWQTFWWVTFPSALPGIAAGGLLAFARAMGEFGATVILAGNMQGEKATLALEIYNELGRPGGDENAMRLTLLSVFTSFIVLFIYERLLRRIDASPLQRKKNSRRKK